MSNEDQSLSSSTSAAVQSLALMPVMKMQEALDRYALMQDFIKQIMVKDHDFGTIPGTDKPCLYKPGAEKLGTLFGLAAKFETVTDVEDWSGECSGGEPLFSYRYRCLLYRGDYFVGSAEGSANSREAKWRYRWVKEVDLPPTVNQMGLLKHPGKAVEFDFAVSKAQTSGPYGKPQEYWNMFTSAIGDQTAVQVTKTDGKGVARPAWEIDMTMWRIPNEDIFSQINTIQKIALKRAYIAAILITTNASAYFTQDLDDLVPSDQPPAPRKPAADENSNAPVQTSDGSTRVTPDEPVNRKPATAPPAAKKDNGEFISDDKLAVLSNLRNKIVGNGYDPSALADVLHEEYGINALAEIKAADADQIIGEYSKILNEQVKRSKKIENVA